jgi:hypothetical protein
MFCILPLEVLRALCHNFACTAAAMPSTTVRECRDLDDATPGTAEGMYPLLAFVA